MTPKNWFLTAATVGHVAAARFAEASVDDVREAVEELGFGARLSLAQLEEVLGLLDEEGDDEDEPEDEGEEGDDEDEPEDEDDGGESEES